MGELKSKQYDQLQMSSSYHHHFFLFFLSKALQDQYCWYIYIGEYLRGTTLANHEQDQNSHGYKAGLVNTSIDCEEVIFYPANLPSHTIVSNNSKRFEVR